ncbi:MAG: hypothetical protein Q9161_008958 [Pseudevernia consocians]
MPWKGVMRTMEAEHTFKTTESIQETTQELESGPQRLKGAEYKAIIRKKRERERADAAKKTEFRLRGKEIKQSKIIRFQEAKIDSQDELSEINLFEEISVMFDRAYPMVSHWL